MLLVDEDVALLGLGDRDHLGVHAEVAGARMDEPQEVHLAVAGREIDAAIVVDAAGLAGDRLELAIEVERVFLQPRDVGVAS